MPAKDGSHVALKQSQQDSLSLTPAQCLLSDPAFLVPATLAEPCLPGPPLACQDVKEDSFLGGWWRGVLDATAVRDPAASTSSTGPGLQKRLRRLQQRSHTLFDLNAIHAQLVQVVQSDSANCLDLPRFTGKAQKREVCCSSDVCKQWQIKRDSLGQLTCCQMFSGQSPRCFVRVPAKELWQKGYNPVQNRTCRPSRCKGRREGASHGL